MAHLYRVILPVSDIEAACAFYAVVFAAPGTRVSPGRHYFDCEGTILACFDPQADGDGYAAKPNPEPIYFAVSDLPASYALCKEAGATFPDDVVPGSDRSARSPDALGAKCASTFRTPSETDCAS